MEFEEVENIGQRIKEIRKSKSITIQKLSQFTDLSVGYLSNLERNQASPTLSNLQRICVALGISIRDLLRPSGEERTLIRQEEQQLYEYDEYKLQIRRLDFGKKRGIYEFSTYLLGPGDSIYIKPNLYHTMRNAGDTPCRSFWHLQIMDDSV